MITGSTAEFEIEIIKFLVQDNQHGKKYIPLIDKDVCEMPDNKAVAELVKNYFERYSSVPKKVNLREFFNKTVLSQKSASKVKLDTVNRINEIIVLIYEPMQAEGNQIKERIIEFCQYSLTKKLFADYSPKLKEGKEIFPRLKSDIVKILSLDEHIDDDDDKKSEFLFAEDIGDMLEHTKVIPIFLSCFHRFLKRKGLAAPELHMLMSGPKMLKTGILLLIAYYLALAGYKVYIADTENGKKDLKVRLKQIILDCTLQELEEREYEVEYQRIVAFMKKLGGEIVIGNYSMNQATMADVDAELQRLDDEYKWRADICLLDYIDLYNPIDKKITDHRLKLQAVCRDAIQLNKKWKFPMITPTKVKQSAIQKDTIDFTDFGEDFGKAYNCHGAWALCATPEEYEAKILRVVSVLQRQGVRYIPGVAMEKIPQSYLKIDTDTGSAQELTFEETMQYIEYDKLPAKKKPTYKKIKNEDIKDN